MTSTEEIQDFVEHLVENRGIRNVTELTRAEQYKLAFWVLINNRMYQNLIRLMQKHITDYIKKTEKNRNR